MVGIGDAIKKSKFDAICRDVNALVDENKELKYENDRMRDLLQNCGYCSDCLWDIESIGDKMVELTEPIWPKDCEPLCESCLEDFKEMFD